MHNIKLFILIILGMIPPVLMIALDFVDTSWKMSIIFLIELYFIVILAITFIKPIKK